MTRALRAAAALLAAVVAAGACSGGGDATSGAVTLQLWSHGGTDLERAALTASLAAFQTAHPEVRVVVTTVPEGEYTTRLQAAVAARTLPDVVDVDGPLVASFAAQGAFAALTPLLPGSDVRRLLPTLRTQGTWDGRLWAVGQFDSGLGIWADRTALRRAGVRIPTGVADAWSAEEMTRALGRLAARDPDGRVLDLREDYGTGEWLTYGFAPLVASAGGDLRMLDSAAVVRALGQLGAWRRFVDPNTDGSAFARRRVALSWVGHWTYPEYRAALGDDLVLLPLPDLGSGSRTASGSWAWAVTSSSSSQERGASLLSWFLRDEEVLRITAANGALPGTTSALARSALHRPGGPLHLYVEQRDAGAAVPRPATPEYPTLTAAFAQAVHAVLEGTPAATAARTAAQQVAAG